MRIRLAAQWGMGVFICAVLVLGSPLGAPVLAEDSPLTRGREAFESKRYEEAFDLLLPYAEGGDPEAQLKIGFIYFFGEGGKKKDHARAHAWVRKSAVQGNTIAQELLAKMFHYGLGVKQDPEQTYYWCLKAAQGGLPDGQAHLGVLYAEGFGVARDRDEATEWFYRAGVGFAREGKREMALNMVDLIRAYNPDHFTIYRLLDLLNEEND